MNRLAIIGASGHGRVVADIAKKNGYTDILFLDDDETRDTCGEYPVFGKASAASMIEADLFLAIGDSEIRERLMHAFGIERFVTLIHPNAVIADDVSIGTGSVIMAGGVINPGAKIGTGCIINTCSSVDHDCVINDYVHASVGVHISGSVVIGKSTWVGAGATVSNNVAITDHCIIGAGTVVIKDIDVSGTYVGVPARLIR